MGYHTISRDVQDTYLVYIHTQYVLNDPRRQPIRETGTCRWGKAVRFKRGKGKERICACGRQGKESHKESHPQPRHATTRKKKPEEQIVATYVRKYVLEPFFFCFSPRQPNIRPKNSNTI